MCRLSHDQSSAPRTGVKAGAGPGHALAEFAAAVVGVGGGFAAAADDIDAVMAAGNYTGGIVVADSAEVAALVQSQDKARNQKLV